MDNAPEIETEDATEAVDDSYLNQLLTESKQLDPSLTLCHTLLAQEIARVRSSSNKFIDLHHESKVKVSVDVRIPTEEFPEFNFVGKILGPKGNSLKRLQDETRTRISVLGRGSIKDKDKEEEMRKQGGKFSHLNEPLHVHIEAYAHPIDGHYRLSHALDQLRWHLEPDYNDDLTRAQVQELAYLRGRGRGRGVPIVQSADLSSRFAPMSSVSFRNPGASRGPGQKAFIGTLTYGRGVLKPPSHVN